MRPASHLCARAGDEAPPPSGGRPHAGLPLGALLCAPEVLLSACSWLPRLPNEPPPAVAVPTGAELARPWQQSLPRERVSIGSDELVRSHFQRKCVISRKSYTEGI